MADLLQFNVSPLELVVRGSAMYWFIFLIFRFVMRRDVGAVGMADVLLLVLIADAAQNAMSGAYSTIAEGFVLVATLIGWNYLLDRLAYRYPVLRKLLEPASLLLVRDGRILRHNMRREFVTMDELTAQLRLNGVSSVSEVREARMESDGKISVVKRDDGSQGAPDDGVPGAG